MPSYLFVFALRRYSPVAHHQKQVARVILSPPLALACVHGHSGCVCRLVNIRPQAG